MDTSEFSQVSTKYRRLFLTSLANMSDMSDFHTQSSAPTELHEYKADEVVGKSRTKDMKSIFSQEVSEGHKNDHLSSPNVSERMKQYESVTGAVISSKNPTIVRINGHSFSKFTKAFKNPADERLHLALVEVCSQSFVIYTGCCPQFVDVPQNYLKRDTHNHFS